MSETKVSEPQKVLVMEKQIGLQMETTISQKMEKLAERYRLGDVREKSPFRNVLNVATELGSGVEVTKNFIRYQVGRSGANRMWREQRDNRKFAVALVDDIDALLEDDVAKVIDSMKRILGVDIEESWRQRVHQRLMQLYLGYLARHQAYLAYEQQQKGGRG